MFDERKALIGIIEIVEDSDEFVSAKARECRFVNCELDAVGNGGKDLVAGSMAVGIVDGFEIVQIKADNGEYAAASHGLSHRVLKSIAKKRAIRQTSEDVVLCDSP